MIKNTKYKYFILLVVQKELFDVRLNVKKNNAIMKRLHDDETDAPNYERSRFGVVVSF